MWHYRHFWEPRDVTAGSIMPRYTWLFDNKIDFSSVRRKVQVMQALGVPYSNEEVAKARETAEAQATAIAKELVEAGAPAKVAGREVIALIAYMQRLGVDYTNSEEAQ